MKYKSCPTLKGRRSLQERKKSLYDSTHTTKDVGKQ